MRDPGLVELERALTYRCDGILSDLSFRTDWNVEMREVRWFYKGGEYRAMLFLPMSKSKRGPTPMGYAEWRLMGRSFDMLPSRPIFAWRRPGMLGWQEVANVPQWRRALVAAPRNEPGNGVGRDAPPDESDDLAGRPVRPLPRLPIFSAAAEATPPKTSDIEAGF